MSAFLRLVRVELSRLLHRRAVLLILASAVVVPVVIGVALTIETRPPSADALADAQRQMEEERTQPYIQEGIEDCIKAPTDWGVGDDRTDAEIEAECREQNEPQLEWYLYTPELSLTEQRDEGTGVAVALLLGIAMMLMGTTFTGYDWSSGSVSNQLLFEPRRVRVWLAKALAVVGVAFTTSVTVISAFWLAVNAVAASRDLPSGGALLLDCLQMGWRTAFVAALAGLIGFALTTLFRSTVATLGILFGVSLAGGALLAALSVSERWNPAINVLAVVTDNATYWAEAPCEGVVDDLAVCEVERKLSVAQGAGFLGVGVIGSCALSLLSFRRRDVP